MLTDVCALSLCDYVKLHQEIAFVATLNSQELDDSQGQITEHSIGELAFAIANIELVDFDYPLIIPRRNNKYFCIMPVFCKAMMILLCSRNKNLTKIQPLPLFHKNVLNK